MDQLMELAPLGQKPVCFSVSEFLSACACHDVCASAPLTADRVQAQGYDGLHTTLAMSFNVDERCKTQVSDPSPEQYPVVNSIHPRDPSPQPQGGLLSRSAQPRSLASHTRAFDEPKAGQRKCAFLGGSVLAKGEG